MLVGIAVGYQNLGTSEGAGAVMNAIPFITLTDATEEGYWLSDLKPQGYLNNKALTKSGVTGQFSVQLLNENGRAIATYKWAHTSGKSGWQNDARWVDPNNQNVVAHQADSDYFFKMGTGLWCFAPAHNGDATAVYSYNAAGQVCTNDVIWKLCSVAGAVAVANPYPVAIRLSSLTPTGYMNNKALTKSGVTGQFSVQLLNENGRAIATYKWAHTSGKSGWQNDARWVDPNNQTVVAGGENDLTILPGQGLWVFAPAHNGDVGNDYTIQVKCPTF